MSAVFSHGRLRLYLLKLLAEGPRHGYELIRLLENRFHGLYAPSAGTIYPRLQRMEADGLITHTASGGRKVYEITDAGRAELDQRQAELVSLEADINASLADLSTLADEVEQGVRGSVRDLKKELREATRQVRSAPPGPSGFGWGYPPRPGAAKPSTPPADVVTELEEKAAQLLAEVRRLARTGRASQETMRATLVVLDGAIDQVRRLLR
ncbi:PadR family transcriptional regulator [Dactylosporangium sp. AC04546]|uniref:PadR family transcriptional regulator n=1 Tax=Dactylosporangium sp. AC04546 TaxID=2862460 RepID=UPI001EE0F253|nr:helix-turn-helix transcriptional regulator [Dactylosporangium sp. AC04546]WVK84916.1 PadR family transcriptional regulator [Dactylosporangium sp. AC04546]